jgi:predicted RNA-binding Zn ribbon-like protein
MEAVEMHEPRNDLCLDFSNTVDWRNSNSRAKDSIDSFDSLLKWSVKTGILGRQEAAHLGLSVSEQRSEQSSLEKALELRETIYKIFSSVAHGRNPKDSDVELLNEFLSAASVGSKVVREEGGYAWEWDVDNSPQGRILWPIAKSAADLLTSGDLDRVRECANEEEGCGWVFMDKTKSRTRRWCSMTGCGNRAKVRAWYDRNEKTQR